MNASLMLVLTFDGSTLEVRVKDEDKVDLTVVIDFLVLGLGAAAQHQFCH